MILSLTLATIIVVPVIAMFGISKIGEMAIGGEGTATWAANATFWNVYSSFSLATIIPFIVGGAIILVFLIVVIRKIEFKGGG